MAEQKAVNRASFSIEKEYQDLLKAIAKKTRRSQTDELRLMIDARAATVGLEPLSEVDPKHSASALQMAPA